MRYAHIIDDRVVNIIVISDNNWRPRQGAAILLPSGAIVSPGDYYEDGRWIADPDRLAREAEGAKRLEEEATVAEALRQEREAEKAAARKALAARVKAAGKSQSREDLADLVLELSERLLVLEEKSP